MGFGQALRLARRLRRSVCAALALCVVVWSLDPAGAHTPTVLDAVAAHDAMVAEHGHSHGFEEDLIWALHGHAHDIADHDHKPVLLSAILGAEDRAPTGEPGRMAASPTGPPPVFRIDRPPRG